MNLLAYKKLFAVIAGFAMLFLMQRYDLYVPGLAEIVQELIISALAAFGVYQVKNADT